MRQQTQSDEGHTVSTQVRWIQVREQLNVWTTRSPQHSGISTSARSVETIFKSWMEKNPLLKVYPSIVFRFGVSVCRLDLYCTVSLFRDRSYAFCRRRSRSIIMQTINSSFLRHCHPEDGYAFSLRAAVWKVEVKLK